MSDKMDGWTWKSADAEAEDPPHDDRQWVVPRRTVAESARATAAWFRAKWIKLTTVLVVLALAVGGWQTYTYLTRYHEQMSGPHGDFPAALGSGAPLRPDHVLPRFDSDPEGFSDGLYLDGDEDEGLTARSLRTGKSYWHYGRQNAQLLDEASTDSTTVLWFSDRLLVALDIHTGKPRWHTEVVGGSNPADANGETSSHVWRSRDVALVVRRDRLAALSLRDGKQLWSAPPPTGCKEWNIQAPIDLTDVTAVDARSCHPGGRSELFGLDRDTGHPLWHLDEAAVDYQRLDSHTLVGGAVDGSMIVTDVSGGRPVTRRTTLDDDLHRRASAADIVLFASGKDDALTAMRAGPDRPRTAWSHGPTKGLRFGYPQLADGRVYVVQSPPPTDERHYGRSGSAQLLVLDAQTGRELHRTGLPASLFENADQFEGNIPAVRGAGSGVVLIGFTGLVFSSTELALAE